MEKNSKEKTQKCLQQIHHTSKMEEEMKKIALLKEELKDAIGSEKKRER